MTSSVDHQRIEISCFIDECLKPHPGLAQWRPSPHAQHFVDVDRLAATFDPHRGEEVIRLLRQLVDEEHHTVLIASHDQRIVPVASRVLRCEDGRLVELD